MNRLHRPLELLNRFAAASEGVTSIEYSILSVGIAFVLITAVNALGDSALAKYTSVLAALQR